MWTVASVASIKGTLTIQVYNIKFNCYIDMTITKQFSLAALLAASAAANYQAFIADIDTTLYYLYVRSQDFSEASTSN